MCAGSDDQGDLASLLRDPLIRLVMNSDGVTEQDMSDLMEQLRRSLATRESEMRSAHARSRCAKISDRVDDLP